MKKGVAKSPVGCFYTKCTQRQLKQSTIELKEEPALWLRPVSLNWKVKCTIRHRK